MFETVYDNSDNTTSRFRIVWVAGFSCVVVIVAVAFGYHLLTPSHYSKEVSLLHEGMARMDVEAALGYPKNKDYYDSLGNVYGIAYEIKSEPLPLVIHYSNIENYVNPLDKAVEWCGFFPVNNSSSNKSDAHDYQNYQFKCKKLSSF